MKKFTNLDREILKENNSIATEFNFHYKTCLNNLDKIKVELDNAAIKQTNDPNKWKYVYSIEKINVELSSILEKLKSF